MPATPVAGTVPRGAVALHLPSSSISPEPFTSAGPPAGPPPPHPPNTGAPSPPRFWKVHKQPRSTPRNRADPGRRRHRGQSTAVRLNIRVSAGELQWMMGAYRQRVGRNLQRSLFLMDRMELRRNFLYKLHSESVRLSKQTSDTDSVTTSTGEYGCPETRETEQRYQRNQAS